MIVTTWNTGVVEQPAAGQTASSRQPQLRVLVVEDQRAFAESMALVIEAQQDLHCIGVSRTASEGVATALSRRPDVIIMDVGLPDLDGIEAIRQIRAGLPEVRVVVLTGRPDATTLARAASAGAAAFLLKDASVEEIVDAVRSASSRRLEVDPAALHAILEPDSSLPAGVTELTQRELEVLAGLGDGFQPKQIARQLGISLPTCRGHIKSLFQKLGAHTALEAVVLAYRYGVLRLPDQPGTPNA